MVQRLFSEQERMKAEIRRLRGKVDAVIVGGQIIPSTSLGGVVPTALQGAILRGNSNDEWERLPIGGEGEVLTVVDGEANWSNPDVFIVNMGAAL